MLNKEEIKRYHEDGYIIPEFKMPENDLLEIEKLHDELIPFLVTIPLQKLAFYSALEKGYDIDKPRNLAKSVTVE